MVYAMLVDIKNIEKINFKKRELELKNILKKINLMDPSMTV